MKEIVIELMQEYLNTLDHENEEEIYTTQRNFAEIGLDGFKNWLLHKDQENLDPYDLMRNKR